MSKKISILIILFIFISAVLFAQSESESGLVGEEIAEETGEEADEESGVGVGVGVGVNKKREDVFLGIGGDTALYSTYDYSYGGSLIIGYGTGIALGLRASLFFSSEDINTLEINALFRFYLSGMNSYQGPYFQIMGGASMFFQNGYFYFPFGYGSISAGLSFGWRFVYAKSLFVEPYIRAGYPFIAGAGVSTGFRF